MKPHDAPATDSKAIITCDTHKGKSLSYCVNCRKVLCENCVIPHTSNAHEIRSPTRLAEDCKANILVHKLEASKKIGAGILRLRKAQDDVQTAADRAVADLKTGLEEFAGRTKREALDRNREIESAVADIITELQKESLCAEYNPELDLAERVLREGHAEMEEMRRLRKADINERCNVKRLTIDSLLRNADNAVNVRLEGFVRDCRDTVDMLRLWEKYSTSRLSGLRQDRMLEVCELDQALTLKTQIAADRQRACAELTSENKTLAEEKAELHRKVEMLRVQSAELTNKVRVLQEQCSSIMPKVNMLEQMARDRREEIGNLEAVLRARRDALDELQRKPVVVTTPQTMTGFEQQQLLLQSKQVFTYEPKNGIMSVYHIELGRTFSVSAGDFNIVPNHDSVQVKNDLYITGGFDVRTMKFTGATFVLSMSAPDTFTREYKADMLLAKSQHKLVLLDTDTIYCLGGKCKEKKLLNYCERYSISADKWAKSPPLNESKIGIAATTFNGTDIYVFGGFKGSFTNSVEHLHAKPEEKWKVIKLSSSGGWIGRSDSGCFQTGPTELLLFGGSDMSSGSTNDCFVYDVEKRTMTKTAGKLGKKEWFAMRSPVRYGGLVYVVGYYERDIHVYSTEKRVWSMIDGRVWLTKK